MQRRSVIALGLLGATYPAAALAASRGWRTLFDGRSLDGWTLLGDANWALKDGAAQADNGKTGFLVSDESFGDVEIRAEFWASDDANSGIFIRCQNPAVIGDETCYEANIFDQRPDPTYGTGAIVKVAAVSPMPKAGGKWNTYEITARGKRLTLVLNGVKTVDVEDSKLASGPFALQWGRGTIKFRKVEITPL